MSDQTKTSSHVLIIDDDREMRASLENLFQRSGWQTECLSSSKNFDQKLGAQTFDLIVSDVQMPGTSGLELLKISDSPNRPPFILISAHGDIAMAVDAMQHGAYSFFEKPFDPKRLLLAAKHAGEQFQLRRRNLMLEQRLAMLSGLDRVLLGNNKALGKIREQVLEFAEVDVAILLLGETGTGKDLVARALHDLSARADQPFVAVNCAAIPPEHFEQMMFGAHDAQQGFISLAEGGTLFLDELGAFPLAQQEKLLRFLETKTYFATGSPQEVRADVRILSATNGAIDEMIAAQTLREDFVFRLNNVTIAMPPLRERKDDVVLLCMHYLAHYAALYEVQVPEMSTSDIAALLAYSWPGNIRELRHVAERRVLAARRGRGSMQEALAPDDSAHETPESLRNAVAAFERELISNAIRIHQGRMDAVAEALGIGRRTLNEKIVKLDLDKSQLL